MSKTLVLYTSLTGNTEMMAQAIIDQLETNRCEIVVKEFDNDPIDVQELSKYDAIFIGVYTWAAGDVPLDVEDFYDDLYNLDLTGKICGVFGSADSSYEEYGTAVDMIYEQLEELGATMLEDRIIVDLEPNSEELKRCRRLADTACDMLVKG
ncbi:MAG TPA: flavodoxin domain-containing protein [Bacillota bacterium]|nr:flavodoxin domain-containing protein [Bacillota bacterium]